MSDLLVPISMGDLRLPNRVIMAPLDACRAGEQRVPNALMAEYYAQRATAGLIVSEATSVTPMGVGYADTPGIWSREQVDGWKLVTKAVHAAGGRILLQLWHVGRISDPSFLNGAMPVAPSAIAANGPCQSASSAATLSDAPRPRAGRDSGGRRGVSTGAENAQAAGFDGVEIHGANGYLLDQFLQDSANHRTDEYGGSIENRARLMLEVVDAADLGLGPRPRRPAPRTPRRHSLDRRLGPCGDFRPRRERSGASADRVPDGPRIARRTAGWGRSSSGSFGGTYIANEKFTQATAEQVIRAGEADAVGFGVLFIANPDLPRRFALKAHRSIEPDPTTFYVPGPAGYIDYPFLEAAVKSA